MSSKFDLVTIAKPTAFEKIEKVSAEGYFQAYQRVLSLLKETIVERGEEQLKARTGYDEKNLPDKTPTNTYFKLDGIKFDIETIVRSSNPKHSEVFDSVSWFLEFNLELYEQGAIKKGFVRPYPVSEDREEPFIRWDFLMENFLSYSSEAMEEALGVVQEIKFNEVPTEYGESLETLAVPLESIKDFDIESQGNAELWYRARKFCGEVKQSTIKPFKQALVTPKKEMPEETLNDWKQIEDIAFKVQAVSSPRREYKKVLDLLFLIPQKPKPKDSKELPTIVTPENYKELLEEYRIHLATLIETGKKIGGKVGEIAIPYYDLEDNEKVQAQFPCIVDYDTRKEGSKKYISLPALVQRMNSLIEDFKKGRTLRRIGTEPIV